MAECTLPRQSDAWVSHMRPYLVRRIEELRDELEAPGSNADRTRGQIEELRTLFRQIEPDETSIPAPPVTPTSRTPAY
jgi:polyhydroxyalkanoate synthesis regulator phasin